MRLGDSLFLFVGLTVLWFAVGLPWWSYLLLWVACLGLNYVQRRTEAAR